MNRIIFIHGNSCSSRIVEPLIKVWNKQTQIVSIELPGHGNTERLNHYSWKVVREYLLRKIHEIEGEKLLIGHSLGGHFAIEMSPNIKSLKGLAIIGTSPLKVPLNSEEAFAPNPNFPTYFKESPEREELEKAINDAVFEKSVFPVLLDDYFKADPKFRVAIGNEIINSGSILNEEQIFSKLNCPKYVINGKQDPIVNFEYLTQLQSNAIYPFKLIEIDLCGHCATIEKPKEFAEILGKIHDEVFED